MTGITHSLPTLTGLEPEDAKAALRGYLRSRRQERSLRRRTDAGDAIAIVGSNFVAGQNATRVAIYASRPTEPTTEPLLQRLEAAGVELLLPVLGDGLQRQWATFKGLDDLVERAPGRPPEPSGPSLPMEEIARADVIFAPALAVDTRGCRLGQGGGWYDRALSHVNPNATILAIVFDDEVFPSDEVELPCEDHDRFVHGALTPNGVRWFNDETR